MSKSGKIPTKIYRDCVYYDSSKENVGAFDSFSEFQD